MSTQFLEIDGVFVQISRGNSDKEEMSTSLADKVKTSFDDVIDTLMQIVRPLGTAFSSMNQGMDVPIEVEKVEVSLGVGFSVEGNIFLAKSKADVNMDIKLTFHKAPNMPLHESIQKE